LLKNLYALLYFTGLKLTCGIRSIFGFRGTTLLLRVWLGLDRSSLSWVCDKPGFNGSFCSGDSSVERGMVSSSRIEIEKFNGKNFELWKLKLEDLLVNKEQWIVLDPNTQPTGKSTWLCTILRLKKKINVSLCYVLFQTLWDNLIVAIGSTTQSTLKYEDVVASLLSEGMRGKSMDGQSTDAIFVRSRTQDRNPGKSSGGRSKSKGRSKSPGKSLRKC
jgi:hypothetical protein